MRLSRQRFARSRAARFPLECFTHRARYPWTPLGFAHALACLIGIFRTSAGALGRLVAFRRRQIDAGAPRFRQPDGHDLFGGTRAMFAAADFVDLLTHKLACLCRCRFALSLVAASFLDCAFIRHVLLHTRKAANNNAAGATWFETAGSRSVGQRRRTDLRPRPPHPPARRCREQISILRHAQCVNAEQTVGPHFQRRPAAAARQRLKRLDRIFVAVLGMDRLAGAEFDRRAARPAPSGAWCWRGASRCGGVRDCRRRDARSRQIEIAAELAIDARQQVEIELRGDALGVVIGGIQDRRRPSPDRRRRSAPRRRPRMRAGATHERARLMRLEIADGRARERSPRAACARPPPAVRTAGVKSATTGMIGKSRKIAAQPRRVLAQQIAGDIDRHIGRELPARAEQDPHFAARAAAEFDQRGSLRNDRAIVAPHARCRMPSSLRVG